MKSFSDYGIAVGEVPSTYNTDNAVELAVATYTDLGLITDAGKAHEAFGYEIAHLQDALPASVIEQPHDIVMVPKLGELSLSDLIGRYDEFSPHPQTYIWDRLWGKYSAEDFNQGQTAAIEAHAVLLGGDNDYDEPGLYFTNQSLKDQRESLKQAQKDHDGQNTRLSTVNPAGYIIRNAMQLERGQQLQDKPTYTRFIEQKSKRVDGDSYVPDADSDGVGRVYLSESHGRAYPGVGVRLAVGQK